MSDTLRIMELVDSLAQVSDLGGACRVLTRSPALGRPFHQALCGLVDDKAAFSEIARYNMQGLPHDFQNLRVWADAPLSRSLVSGEPRLFHRNQFSSLHPDIRFDWSLSAASTLLVVPVPERGVPYGAVLLFSEEYFETIEIGERHRDLVLGSVKLQLRAHEWRNGLASTRSRAS